MIVHFKFTITLVETNSPPPPPPPPPDKSIIGWWVYSSASLSAVSDEVLIAGFGQKGHAIGDIPGETQWGCLIISLRYALLN